MVLSSELLFQVARTVLYMGGALTSADGGRLVPMVLMSVCDSVRVRERASVRCASVLVCERASVRACECASVRVCECESVRV